MRIDEILCESESQYSIFVDLDGVLVNFADAALKLTGMLPDANKKDYDKDVKKQFWTKIRQHMEEGKPFFSTMEPMADAHVLWNYLKKYNPTILSSTGRSIPGIEQQKKTWVSNHLGNAAVNSAIFVQSAALKAQYAGPANILIDDRADAINPWISSGGIGILHTSAADTIKQLNKLGL